jgi:hypothetical protein
MFLLWATAVFVGSRSSACPLCHDDVGVQVRAGIFNDDFGFNLFALVLPFAVTLGFAATVHFGGSIRKKAAHAAAEEKSTTSP